MVALCVILPIFGTAKSHTVQIYQAGAGYFAASVSAGQSVGNRNACLIALLKHHFLAQREDEFIHACQSAILAILMHIHTRIVEAQ